MITKDNAHEVLQYRAATDDQVQRMAEIRRGAETMINAILTHAPTCPDQQAAIRKIREAMMTANASIVLDGLG